MSVGMLAGGYLKFTAFPELDGDTIVARVLQSQARRFRGPKRARFRAIFLTTTTTAAGLLPILTETSLQAQILIPLVASLVFGLVTASLIVRFALPAIYAILNDLGLSTLAEERRMCAHRTQDQGASVSVESA